MSSKMDRVSAGISMTSKVVVSLLWIAGAVIAFQIGVWYLGLLAIAYLGYLWVLGGRWLIY